MKKYRTTDELLLHTGTYDKKVIDGLKKSLKVRRSYNFLEIMDID